MEKIFLDANIFIDIMEKRDNSLAAALAVAEAKTSVSVLSIEVWAYIYKRVVPDKNYMDLFDTYNFVDYTVDIAKRSSLGPTSDFEDNVQLHSALDSGCSVFITKDKKLLKLGYFGNVRICERL